MYRPGGLFHSDADGLARIEDVGGSLRFQLKFVAGSGYDQIENTAEGVYVFQLHAAPCLGQGWCDGERTKAGGANSKKAFRENAAIEGALGGEVGLSSFGTPFDRVRDVVTEQTTIGVPL